MTAIASPKFSDLARHPVVPLLAILLLAASLRAAHLAEASALPAFENPVVDERAYHEHARAIAAGDWLLDETPLRMSPGYPYLLGAVYALGGDGPWPIAIVQSLLGLLAIVLVWDAARRTLGPAWAWLPALGLAIYGPAIFYESVRLATSTALTAHALLLWAAVRVLGRADPRARDWLLVGLAWGACCALRPNALLLGLPLLLAAAGWLAWPARLPGRRAAGAAAALVAGWAVFVAPIATRNFVASGEFVLLTDHGGQNFYIGNGPGASGSWRIPTGVRARGIRDSFDGFHAAAERIAGRTLSTREADAFWYRRGLEEMRADPAEALELLARKFYLYWNGYELASVHHYAFQRRVNPVLGWPLLQFTVLAPLALLGSLLALGRTPALRFVGLFNLTCCAAIVAFFVLGRYRLPMIPGGLIAAGCVLQTLVRWARGGRVLRLGAGLAALLAAAALARPIGFDPRFADEYVRLGHRYQQHDRLHEAEAAYAEALALEPDHLPARYALARLLSREAHTPVARTHWQRLLEAAQAQDRPDLVREARRRLQRPEARRP